MERDEERERLSDETEWDIPTLFEHVHVAHACGFLLPFRQQYNQ
jgi:hypothetical protein